MPLVSRTRATLRSAEFGFLGVCVKTRTQTPRFCGLSCSAGLLVLLTIFLRPARTSWLIVGIVHLVISPPRPRHDRWRRDLAARWPIASARQHGRFCTPRIRAD